MPFSAKRKTETRHHGSSSSGKKTCSCWGVDQTKAKGAAGYDCLTLKQFVRKVTDKKFEGMLLPQRELNCAQSFKCNLKK
jgi:hypothetical protein